MRLGHINSRGGSGQAAIALIITGIAASLIAGCAPAAPAAARKAAPAKASNQGKLVHARHQRARQAVNVYARIGAGMMNPRWADDPYRIYVPNSLSNTVTEINPRSYKIIRTFAAGQQPNHITPSWNG
ncbi:MAG: hypothetical protein J2P32_05185, partial [Actinobacteria bacterium]|nr:hypothetical protein [Actinomycetota bacterium]